MENAPALPEVAWLVASFLLPPTQALSENVDFKAVWPIGGQWVVKGKEGSERS